MIFHNSDTSIFFPPYISILENHHKSSLVFNSIIMSFPNHQRHTFYHNKCSSVPNKICFTNLSSHINMYKVTSYTCMRWPHTMKNYEIHILRFKMIFLHCVLTIDWNAHVPCIHSIIYLTNWTISWITVVNLLLCHSERFHIKAKIPCYTL